MKRKTIDMNTVYQTVPRYYSYLFQYVNRNVVWAKRTENPCFDSDFYSEDIKMVLRALFCYKKKNEL